MYKVESMDETLKILSDISWNALKEQVEIKELAEQVYALQRFLQSYTPVIPECEECWQKDDELSDKESEIDELQDELSDLRKTVLTWEYSLDELKEEVDDQC